MLRVLIGIAGLVPAQLSAQDSAASDSARARTGHRRVTLTAEALHLFVPVSLVKAELALHETWGGSLRGGYGKYESGIGSADGDIIEIGAQGIRYLGRFDRGFQLGCDFRLSRLSQPDSVQTLILGLGDGFALGPFLGYKRAYRAGFTLETQIGLQWGMGQSEKNPLLHLALSGGWSFWRAGGAGPPADEVLPVADAPTVRGPMDHHDGFTFGLSLGGGIITAEGCSNCGLRPGIAANSSIGWFLNRRWGIYYDATAAVGVLKDAPASLGNIMQGPALQFWPHRDFWIKAGIVYARLLTATPFGSDEVNGGGMILAAGYEFHRRGNRSMDIQLRATHGDFDSGSSNLGIDTYSLLLGWNWF